MKWKTWVDMFVEPSKCMLRIRDWIILWLIAMVVSLLCVMLIAACGECFFNMAADELLGDYGVAINVANTGLAVYYLREPLRRMGLLEHL